MTNGQRELAARVGFSIDAALALVDASIAWVNGAGTSEVDLAMVDTSTVVHSVSAGSVGRW